MKTCLPPPVHVNFSSPHHLFDTKDALILYNTAPSSPLAAPYPYVLFTSIYLEGNREMLRLQQALEMVVELTGCHGEDLKAILLGDRVAVGFKHKEDARAAFALQELESCSIYFDLDHPGIPPPASCYEVEFVWSFPPESDNTISLKSHRSFFHQLEQSCDGTIFSYNTSTYFKGRSLDETVHAAVKIRWNTNAAAERCCKLMKKQGKEVRTVDQIINIDPEPKNYNRFGQNGLTEGEWDTFEAYYQRTVKKRNGEVAGSRAEMERRMSWILYRRMRPNPHCEWSEESNQYLTSLNPTYATTLKLKLRPCMSITGQLHPPEKSYVMPETDVMKLWEMQAGFVPKRKRVVEGDGMDGVEVADVEMNETKESQ